MVGQYLSNADAETPDLLQQYELLDEIGTSARGRVYQAHDRVLDQIVAVKLLRSEIGGDPDLALRLYHAARAAANLRHPNIVAVYDNGAHAGSAFITMEHVAGRDLAALLTEEGTLPPRRAVAIIDQVLDALTAAHEHGLAHGDLHPHNILLRGESDQIVLTDFGMGLVQDWAGSVAPYRAPEELAGRAAGPAADIYAAGAILHTLITGQPPTQGRAVVWPGRLAQRLEVPIRRALAATPAERYPSAAALREALVAITGPVAAPKPPAEPSEEPVATLRVRVALRSSSSALPAPRRRLHWGRLGALIGLLLLIILIAVVGLTQLLRNRDAATPTVVVAAPPAASDQPDAAPTIAPAVIAAEPTPELPIVATATSVATTAPTPVPVAVAPTAAPASPTPAIPTPIPTIAPIGFSLGTFTPAQLAGAYRRDDGTLYGRQTVALYGASTSYNQGKLTFTVPATPTVPLTLVLAGLDDELAAHCTLAVIINDTTVFLGPTTFPNAPAADHGVGGTDRYWDVMTIALPPNLLHAGTNTLTLQNRTAGANLGVPYILISDIVFEETR